ncbi:MAG: NUDIX hydrolase [Gemmatirosa sp.]|nr:NUDIX hydrolase [Gemmatirosa sp.]
MSDEQNAEQQPGQISSEPIYAGRIVKLFKDTVRFPNGTTGQLDIVRHPGASAVVPFLSDPAGDDPQLLLIKQYRYAAGGFIYEIPAGMLDKDEDPLHCAHRELKEETGCTAKSMEHIFTLLTTPGFTDERISIYLATGLERGETAHESDEFLTVETVALSAALEMIQSGQIQDGKTALGILFAAGFRAGR